MSLFCPKCSNLFYHKEISKKLFLNCKNCGYQEETSDSLVSTKIYKSDLYEEIFNKEYLKYDVSYPRTTRKRCPNKECESRKDKKKQEAIFFPDKETMKLTYICICCDMEWKIS